MRGSLKPYRPDSDLKTLEAKEEETMLCQNCGRQVEFVGNVCPWCGAQKLQSQTIHIFLYIGGFIGLCIGGRAGYVVSGDDGVFVGALIGGIIGGVLGLFKGSAALKQQVSCPHCNADLEVDRAQGPNYNCPECGGIFHL